MKKTAETVMAGAEVSKKLEVNQIYVLFMREQNICAIKSIHRTSAPQDTSCWSTQSAHFALRTVGFDCNSMAYLDRKPRHVRLATLQHLDVVEEPH